MLLNDTHSSSRYSGVKLEDWNKVLLYFFHAEYAEIAEAIRNRNAIICKEYAKAHATLAPPSGRQAQTMCVRFREFCVFGVRCFYQTIISFFDHGSHEFLLTAVSPCGLLGKLRV